MRFFYILCVFIASVTSKPWAQPNDPRVAARTIDTIHDTSLNKRQEQTLQDCLGASDVPVRFASAEDFEELKEPFNLRLAYNPAVIVLPTTSQHVSDAVICAGTHNVKVQAKSGGHSYASYSSGGQDGSMIIDLQSFQTISVDTSTNIATVGSGVRLGNLATSIYNSAHRALPHGTCPGVGIGGHATHGGFGYSSRAWGLTLDTIVGLDVVLVNGTQLHVSESEPQGDLWYALRGAAADFAVVTTFYLQTLPAPDQVVNYDYSLPGMFTSASATASVFGHIQDFALNASLVDRNLGLGVYLDGRAFSVSGTYFGSIETFNSTLAPALLAGLPTPAGSSYVRSVSWLDSLLDLANQPLPQPLTGYDAHDTFFAKSVVTPASDPLTQAQLEQYFTYIIANGVDDVPPGTWFSILNLYGGPDSRINAVDAEASAYSHRDSLWVVQHYRRDSDLAFVEGLNGALTRLMEGEGVDFAAYQNYVDPSLGREEAHRLYYGSETTGRLVGVKRRVDEAGVLWNPQSIEV